jgi:hypothetical protein
MDLLLRGCSVVPIIIGIPHIRYIEVLEQFFFTILKKKRSSFKINLHCFLTYSSVFGAPGTNIKFIMC